MFLQIVKFLFTLSVKTSAIWRIKINLINIYFESSLSLTIYEFDSDGD